MLKILSKTCKLHSFRLQPPFLPSHSLFLFSSKDKDETKASFSPFSVGLDTQTKVEDPHNQGGTLSKLLGFFGTRSNNSKSSAGDKNKEEPRNLAQEKM
jgi:hypothetical protein